MSIQIKGVKADSIPWLLEPDPDNPGVRYFALRYLFAKKADDPEVRQAQADVMSTGPVPAILDAQHPDGYWVKPGGGYTPSYRSTVWSVMYLAELGADPADPRVRRGCEYVLAHSIAVNGGFSLNDRPVPSGVIHCLNGDLLYALLTLGYGDDPRLQTALDWQARAITGEGDVKYYKSGTSGPGFGCGYNSKQSCGWGANKALRALSAVPQDLCTPEVQRAIEAGVEFLFSRDPAIADYPYTGQVSSSWFKFSFPLSYRSDVLETAAVLVSLDCGDDPRLDNLIDLIRSKANEQGRWTMETSINGKMWADIEEKGKPSKWVTLRALRVLGKTPTQK